MIKKWRIFIAWCFAAILATCANYNLYDTPNGPISQTHIFIIWLCSSTLSTAILYVLIEKIGNYFKRLKFRGVKIVSSVVSFSVFIFGIFSFSLMFSYFLGLPVIDTRNELNAACKPESPDWKCLRTFLREFSPEVASTLPQEETTLVLARVASILETRINSLTAMGDKAEREVFRKRLDEAKISLEKKNSVETYKSLLSTRYVLPELFREAIRKPAAGK
jgi:hypothetical protein